MIRRLELRLAPRLAGVYKTHHYSTNTGLSKELSESLYRILYSESFYDGLKHLKVDEDFVEKILKENYTNPAVLYNIGMYYQSHGNYERAIQLYDEFDNMPPLQKSEINNRTIESPGVLNVRLGNLNHMVRNFSKSEEHYKKALTISPYNSMAHFGLAVLLTQIKGREYEAKKHFNVALRHNLTNKHHLGNMSIARMQGQYMDYIREVVNKDPEAFEKWKTDNDEYVSILSDSVDPIETVEEIIQTNTLIEPEQLDDIYYVEEIKLKGSIVGPKEPIMDVEQEKIALSLDSAEAGVIVSNSTIFKDKVHYNVMSKVLPIKVRRVSETVKEVDIDSIESTVEQVAQVLKKCSKIVVLTGSGVSVGTPSNLKTRKDLWSTLDREEYVAIWRHTQDPSKIWDLVNKFLSDANFNPQPNEAHEAISLLEHAGKVTGIITQNVDELHQKAGSTNVVEMHGTLSRTRCTYCQIDQGPCDKFLSGPYPPICPCYRDEKACYNYTNKPGVLRPDVVLFGENVQPKDLQKAFELATDCDAMLIVGTAMDVAPTAELPVIASENGAVIVEMKRNPSRLSYQGVTNHFIRGEASTNLPLLVSKILE